MLYQVVYTLPICLGLSYPSIDNTQGTGKARAHTHNEHTTQHTARPARHRHHLGTTTQHHTQGTGSASITQRDTPPKGRGNLKIFRSARGQSTSHIFWVFQKGVANFIFSEFPKGAPPSTQLSH